MRTIVVIGAGTMGKGIAHIFEAMRLRDLLLEEELLRLAPEISDFSYKPYAWLFPETIEADRPFWNPVINAKCRPLIEDNSCLVSPNKNRHFEKRPSSRKSLQRRLPRPDT